MATTNFGSEFYIPRARSASSLPSGSRSSLGNNNSSVRSATEPPASPPVNNQNDGHSASGGMLTSEDGRPYRKPDPIRPVMYIYREPTSESCYLPHQHMSEHPQQQQQQQQQDIGRLSSDMKLRSRGKLGFLSNIRFWRKNTSARQYKQDERKVSSMESSRSHSSRETHPLTIRSEMSSKLSPCSSHYVKPRSKSKDINEFDHIAHAQTLEMVASNDDLSERSTRLSEHGALSARRKSDEGHPNAIWAMEISSDGKYLAAAGQHGVIKIWSLNDHAYGERDVSMTTDGISSRSLEEASIKVFNDTPLQEFAGHSAAVLDLSWSKTHFLLSSSMDNRVILWHASMKECLCVFQHSGSVTSVAFHPVDDRIFLSGSLDGKVRIWSVPDRSCVACSALPDDGIVTAVGFAKDGKLTCAGSSDGQLFLYETEKLKFISKMAIKKDNSKKGQKITAIQPMPGSAENVLVTSNDSYIRLIKVTERQLLHHYKGADNEASQIRASFSDDGSYVICGSDKSTVHVWRTGTRDLLDVQPLNEEKANASPGSSSGTRHLMDSSPDDRKEHRRLSSLIRGFDQQLKDLVPNHDLCFSAHEGTVTCAIFAPRGTRQRLAITGNDAIYNFTPVVYARYDKNKPNSRPSETNIEVSEHVPDADKEDRYQQQELLERAQYSYSEGHIIVTADESGIIKVWRVDSGVYGSDKSVEHEEKRAFSGNTSLSPECISRTPPSTSISNRFKEFIKRATR